MDSRLLVFGLVLSIATGIIFGLLPALRATRMDLNTTIKASDQGPGKPGFWRGRLAGRNVLVSVQLALSVVLAGGVGIIRERLCQRRVKWIRDSAWITRCWCLSTRA